MIKHLLGLNSDALEDWAYVICKFCESGGPEKPETNTLKWAGLAYRGFLTALSSSTFQSSTSTSLANGGRLSHQITQGSTAIELGH